MNRWMYFSMAAMLGMQGSAAIAGDFDGSRKLICAPVQVMECYPGEGCGAGLPEEVGAPAFMRVDFDKKTIVGPKRTSPIRSMEKDENQILMQGTELGMAWSMALDIESGRMVTSFSTRDGAYVLFGSCTPL